MKEEITSNYKKAMAAAEAMQRSFYEQSLLTAQEKYNQSRRYQLSQEKKERQSDEGN